MRQGWEGLGWFLELVGWLDGWMGGREGGKLIMMTITKVWFVPFLKFFASAWSSQS